MSRPRIRSLKPECWQDEALGSVSRDARLLFVGLITQADDSGRLKAATALVRSQIFPYDADLPLETVDGWLSELHAAGLISLYQAGSRTYAALGGWHNQKVDHAKESEIPPPPEHHPADTVANLRDDSRSVANVRESSPSRAAARSDPIPDPIPDPDPNNSNGHEPQRGDPAAAVERAVVARLAAVADARNFTIPSEQAIRRAIADVPGIDHLAVADDLEFWALHGPGANRRKMAVANTYRNFCKRAAKDQQPTGGTRQHPSEVAASKWRQRATQWATEDREATDEQG